MWGAFRRDSVETTSQTALLLPLLLLLLLRLWRDVGVAAWVPTDYCSSGIDSSGRRSQHKRPERSCREIIFQPYAAVLKSGLFEACCCFGCLLSLESQLSYSRCQLFCLLLSSVVTCGVLSFSLVVTPLLFFLSTILWHLRRPLGLLSAAQQRQRICTALVVTRRLSAMTSPAKRQRLEDHELNFLAAEYDNPLLTSPLPLPLPIIHPSSFPILPSTPLSYRSQQMSAPMVRISTLPFRLLARHYGATLVYSEELIANKLQHCQRSINPTTATIDFALPGGKGGVVFSTYPGEPVVCQLGASNAADALRAAEVVAGDVRAIDLNMGCPEHFSTQGGMGSALLRRPDTAVDILTTLRRNLPSTVAVTCKIRLLDTAADTVELMRRLEATGVDAIAVHARRVPDRPRHRALIDQLPLLFSLRNVACVYNGDLFSSTIPPAELSLPAGTSVLVGRGAMWNPSIFAASSTTSSSPLPLFPVVDQYIRTAAVYSPAVANTKYVALEMLKGHCSTLDTYRDVVQAKDAGQLEAAVAALTAEVRQRAVVDEVERKEWAEVEESGMVIEGGGGGGGRRKVERRLKEMERMRQLLYGPYHPPAVRWEERPSQIVAEEKKQSHDPR